MKVLRIIARLNVGGPARHVVWLTEALNDGEFETRLIAGTVPEGEEDMAYFAAQHGVEPVFIPEMSRELSLKDVVSVWKVYRQINEFKPDVVHTHTAKAGTVGRLGAFAFRWLTPRIIIGRPRKVRVVHTFHGHVFHSYYGNLKTRIFLLIERWLARLATDKIIAITDQQFREINKDFRVGKSKQFHVVPLGIDLSPFKADTDARERFRNEIGASDDETVIGFIGRLTEIKNISMFLKAAADVCSRTTAEEPVFRFVIVGDGRLREELQNEANDIGLSQSVVFAGNRTDTPAAYAGVDIVALTSLNEGTPLSLIEAMAAGKPVISTAVGGVTDLLGPVSEEKQGFALCERGISVRSGDAEGMASGFEALRIDKELRERLGMAGQEFVREKYSKDRLVNDIKELYRQLIAEAH